MTKTVGEMLNLISSFQWNISEFFSLTEKLCECYSSPEFEFGDASWCLEIWPNGDEVINSGWIAIFLAKVDSTRFNHVITYTISIKDKDGNVFKCMNDIKGNFAGNENSWGWNKFLELSKLFEEKHKIVSDGVLSITCTLDWERAAAKDMKPMTAPRSDAIFSTPKILLKTLNRNFKDLFLNQKDCDVVIKVQDKEIQAHKLVLKARSTVFAAMFEHDLTENRSGEVNISDTEADIFRDVLLYMYSGETDCLSTKNVCELYELADKYNLEDLKEECLKFMECCLSVDTVCDILTLSDKYAEMQLNELAVMFLRRNRVIVLGSEKWKKLEQENYLFVIKILKSIVLDNVI